MAMRLLFFCVEFCDCATVHNAYRITMYCYMQLPGSMGVPSLWHRYFGGRGQKSVGTPDVEEPSVAVFDLSFLGYCRNMADYVEEDWLPL